jgi:hypothetical protein
VNVRRSRPADSLATGRHDTVVCLIHDPLAPGDTAVALALLDEHTEADVPLVVVGLAPDAQLDLPGESRRELLALPAGAGSTLDELVARADRLAAPADLVLIAAACRVPAGWLQRLRAAALSDATVATATPLSNDGGTVDVRGSELAQSDRLVAAASLQARPRLLIGGPHCLYVRRSALELIGGPPAGQSGLGGQLAALCESCVGAGMLNVVADDLYVECDRREPRSAELPGSRLGELDRSDERSALRRTLSLARVALTGLTVTIDGRSLGPGIGGTQLYTLELALALGRAPDVRVRVVVAPDIGTIPRERLAQADSIEVVTYEQAAAGIEPSDVVHRPQQVFSVDDLLLLRLLGRRLVVTHQDLISYHNPTYHASVEDWERYRRVTRIALSVADRVVFFSEHSRRDAQAEDLVAPSRSDVIGIALGDYAPPPRAPVGLATDRQFILCLAPDYKHKNRRFALELTAALRAEHQWPGILVLAGAHVPHGSSESDERELLAADPGLGEAVVDLGQVDDYERAWLFANARALLVPSVVEGFGLVPLEAARAGKPCLFAPQSSLPEVISSSLATLVAWDASLSAARILPLLADGPQRREHVEQLQAQAGRWSWEQLADQVVQSYRRALQMPYRTAAERVWQEAERERYLIEIDRARDDIRRVHEELLEHLGDGIALASDQGFLTPRQQRGLLRVGSRPGVARAALWPFAVLGSIRPWGRRSDP